MLDSLALNLFRIMCLFQGILFSMLAGISRDPDTASQFEAGSMSGFMLFDNPQMLPPEMLVPVLQFFKVMIIAIPILAIWTQIIKPLIIGG